MLKIITVDPDKKFMEKIKKIINTISVAYDFDIIVEEYSNFCQQLKIEIENTEIKKIYILEIDLKSDLSGINIAELIRKTDWDSEILFVTNNDKMFETAHRSVPKIYSYIEKFHNFDSRLYNDLVKIFKYNFDNDVLKYKIRNSNVKIFYKSILYIYRDTVTRKLVVVTNNHTYCINLAINEITSLLDDRFAVVHRSCIVNLEKVNRFEWNENSFVLENGDKINLLSKKYKNEIEEKINNI